MRGKGPAGAMQFAAHGISGLADERGDFLVAQFLVRDEQQQQPVFVGKLFQRFLDPVAKFLDFQNAQRGIGLGGRVFQMDSSALVTRLRLCQLCRRLQQ